MRKDRYDEIYREVSEELGIPMEVVRLAYKSAWRFAKSKIRDLDFKDVQSQEDITNLKSSFYFPRMGKLYVSYRKVEKLRRRQRWREENIYKNVEDKEDKAIVHGDSDHDGEVQ